MKVDWDFAAGVARVASGDPPGVVVPTDLGERSEQAAEHVLSATGMTPATELPQAEWVTRSQWIDANLQTMRSMVEPVLERAKVPKGATPVAGNLASASIALEIGALLGMMSRRVLGQLEIDLLDPDRPARLLMVGPNLDGAPGRMGVDRDEFVTWVLLHEMTHAVQFTSVPWLRTELGAGVRELIAMADLKPDPIGLLKRGVDVRQMVGALREGGLLGVAVGPEKRAVMTRIQGTMGLVEGHAEWAMDAAGEAALDDVAALRDSMTERRSGRPVLLKVLDRLLGFEMKLKQYEQGKAFCDRVASERGEAGLLAAWESPQSAPTAAELKDPALWLQRTTVR